jgi:aminopeptidase N
VWPQRVDVWLAWRDSALALPVISDAAETRVPAAEGLPAPRLLLPDASGLGYAHFLLDDATLAWTADSLAALPTPVTRGSATLALYDALLTNRILPDRLLETLLTAVSVEPEQLLVERYLATMVTVFWRFMTPDQRAPAAGQLEDVLWHGLGNAQGSSAKAAWFAALRDIASTPATLQRLHDIWAQRDSVIGLPLAERDYTALAQSLAIRGIDGSARMLEQQLVRIDNPDRRARFAFIVPALSPDTAVRDGFFHSLADVSNRSHEPWVLDALAALNHPVRAASAEKFIRPALELLPEIQRTGDIFFPRRWAGALLSGHATPSAAAEVRAFLDETPDLAPRLRGIVLQAADELFRAADLQ